MKFLSAFLSLVLCATVAGQTPTQVTTLTKPNYNVTNFYKDPYTNSGRGFLFTTDDKSYELNSLVLSLQQLQAGSLNARLVVWDGTGTLPEAVTFTHSGIGNSSPTDVTFLPDFSVTLAPYTTYAMELTVNTGFFQWTMADDSAGFDTAAGNNTWLVPSGAVSSGDGGASWLHVAEGVARLRASVQATEISAVPEPSTYAAIVGAMALAVVFIRRLPSFSTGRKF